AYGFGQGAMLVAARRHPAQGFFLRGATFQKRRLGQGLFHLRQFDLPLRGNAVHDHVLEHGKPFVGSLAISGTVWMRWGSQTRNMPLSVVTALAPQPR